MIVAFLSDFGLADDYVGTCHAVMRRIAPALGIVDVTHGIPPQGVLHGALVLAATLPYMPDGVSLAVVDPGVGSERRAVALRDAGGRLYVGPDNGLLLPAAERNGGVVAAHALADERYRLPAVSATFHGRDLFAPAAARLACGVQLTELGRSFEPATLVRPDLPDPEVGEGHLRAPAVGIDRFGNVQLLAREADLAAAGFTRGDRIWAAVSDRRHPATVARVFADAAHKGMLVHIDSHGMVALAVNGGDAARRVGIAPGAEVTLGRWDLRR